MTQTLYNLRHDGEQYRVTKFVDGEVEASYLTTHTECDCPAGFRQTCRHRQMLPDLLPIADTHWFLDHGTREVVDLMGFHQPKLCAPAEQDTERQTITIIDEFGSIDPKVWDACVPAGLPAESSHKAPIRTSLPPASWRRL